MGVNKNEIELEIKDSYALIFKFYTFTLGSIVCMKWQIKKHQTK